MKRNLLKWLYKEVVEQFCIITIGLLWLLFVILTARGLLSETATSEVYRTYIVVAILTIATTVGVVIVKAHKTNAKLQAENDNLKKEFAEVEEFFGTLELCIPKDIDKNGILFHFARESSMSFLAFPLYLLL